MLHKLHSYVLLGSQSRRSWWSCGLSRGSEAARLLGQQVRLPPGRGCPCLLSVVCCQVAFSATERSLTQRNPTKRGASECNLETSTMKRPRPTTAVEPRKKERFLNKDRPFRFTALTEWFYNRGEVRLLSSRTEASNKIQVKLSL